MEDFRPEDKGRLTTEKALQEAEVLKDIARMIVNHGLNKIAKEAHKYDKLEQFQDFSQYWDELVKKHLGTIGDHIIEGRLEYVDLETLKGLKGQFFNFLDSNLLPIDYYTHLEYGTKYPPPFYHKDELISKETYEKAHKILSKRSKIFELIKLVIEGYFTNEKYNYMTRYMRG